jgi:glycogen(starch) synthase
MRVLVVSNRYPPGDVGAYENECQAIAEGLGGRGHEVRVLTAPPPRAMPERESSKGPPVSRALSMAGGPDEAPRASTLIERVTEARAHFVSASNVYGLGERVEAFEPDVAYLWNLGGLGGLGLLECLQFLGVSWVWHLLDAVPLQLCSLGGHVVPGLAASYGSRYEGEYLLGAEHLLAEIEDAGLRLAGERTVVPPWVHDGPAPRTFERPLRDGLRILYSGELTEAGRVPALVEAAARLRAWGHEGFQLELHGPIADGSTQASINLLGLRDVVTLGSALSRAELSSAYRRSDASVFTLGERDRFGDAPLQAAILGCVPVISTECSAAEWLIGGVDCLKYGGTGESLARRIGELLDGAVSLAGVAARARDVALREYRVDAALDRVESALERAAQRRAPGLGTAKEAHHMALLAESVMVKAMSEEGTDG